MDLPLGGILALLKSIFEPIIEILEKFLFFRAYQISTLYRSYQEVLGMPPDELSNDIEYRVYWKRYHLRKKLTTPMIWVKSKKGKTFSKLILSITASNKKIKYQDHITIVDVSDTPIQVALPSIPFRDLKFSGNRVLMPYHGISTRLLEAYDSDGNEVNFSFEPKDYIIPLDRLEVALGEEKGDIEKWGDIFNLEFIETEIKEEKIRLIGGMFGEPAIFSFIRERLFSMSWLVKLIFWSKNIVTARQLTREFDLYLEQQEEFNKREKERETA